MIRIGFLVGVFISVLPGTSWAGEKSELDSTLSEIIVVPGIPIALRGFPFEASFAHLTAPTRDIRRTWSVKCNAANFDIYDVFPAERVQLTVTNKGVCPFKLTFTKDDGATQDFTIPAGTPRTVTRSDITKITVDCDGLVADDCKASYTLTELPAKE